MEPVELISRDNSSKIKNYDEFFELRQSVFSLGAERLFAILFPIALQYELDGASTVAAMLLIEFDPKALRSSEEMLLEVADSNWELSDKLIPFYLVTQFGKHNIICEIDKLLLSKAFNYDQRTRVEGIKYWAEMPAASLTADYTYFEWQEAIEGKNA